MSQFQALILAGGIGKRMWPLTSCKSLLEFYGQPIIRYIVNDLKSAGITDFIIVCEPRSFDRIKSVFANETVNISFIKQNNIPGMAGAVLSAASLLKQPLVIISPEDLLNPKAYTGFIKKCQLSKSDIVLAGIHKKEYFPGGYLMLDGKKVIGLAEKPGEGKQPSDYVRLVMDYFREPEIFIDFLKKSESSNDDVYESALDKMIKNGRSAEVFEYNSYWQSLKYPWHILEMMETIFKFRSYAAVAEDVQISPKATVKGDVVIETGVKIMEGACITGPAYIGKNCIIGTNALVRESNISANCVIGFGSEIARSWIGEKCWFHTNYIGDSVLEENISFGAGAITANFRLDAGNINVKNNDLKINTGRTKLGAIIGKGARIGVNASLMPGISVGRGSFVSSGVVLNRNLAENKFCCLFQNAFTIKDKR